MFCISYEGATLTSGLEKSMFLLDLRSEPCCWGRWNRFQWRVLGFAITNTLWYWPTPTQIFFPGRLFLNATSGTHFYFYQESVTSQSFLQDYSIFKLKLLTKLAYLYPVQHNPARFCGSDIGSSSTPSKYGGVQKIELATIVEFIVCVVNSPPQAVR